MTSPARCATTRDHSAHAPPEALARSYLVIGPWDHGGTQTPAAEIDGLCDPRERRARHEEAARGLVRLGARARVAARSSSSDRVAYYMMGANEWRYAHTLGRGRLGQGRWCCTSVAPGAPRTLRTRAMLAATAPRREPAALLVSDPRELPELEVAKEADGGEPASQFRAGQKRAVVFDERPAGTRTSRWPGTCGCMLACAADTPDFDLWAQVLLVRADGSAVQPRAGHPPRPLPQQSPFTQELLRPGELARFPSSSTGRRGECRPVRACGSSSRR